MRLVPSDILKGNSMKKLKKIVVPLVAIFGVVILLQICFVSGITGKIGLIYLPTYFNDTLRGGFTNPDDVYSIHILDKKAFVLSRGSLKYCQNLRLLDLDIISDTTGLKNLDFLKNLDDLESISLQCKSDDWSGLLNCRNLRYIKIFDSDFADFKYLKNMNKIERLDISSVSELKYSDDVSFVSVDEIYIEAPDFDFSIVKTAVNTTFLAIKSQDIYEFDEIKNMNSLKMLKLIETDINMDILALISKIESLEKLQLTECNFSISEEQVNEALKSFYERKVEVTLNDCVFSE